MDGWTTGRFELVSIRIRVVCTPTQTGFFCVYIRNTGRKKWKTQGRKWAKKKKEGEVSTFSFGLNKRRDSGKGERQHFVYVQPHPSGLTGPPSLQNVKTGHRPQGASVQPKEIFSGRTGQEQNDKAGKVKDVRGSQGKTRDGRVDDDRHCWSIDESK